AIMSVQQRLYGVPGLELHAQHFFHVSVQTCGFAHEVALDQDAVTRALVSVEPFEVVLGGVNAFHSAVFPETHSGGGLQRLRSALRRGLAPKLERVDPFERFLFHLTVGYLSEEADAGALRERLRELREQCTARLKVDAVHLVELPTDQREAFPNFEPVSSF